MLLLLLLLPLRLPHTFCFLLRLPLQQLPLEPSQQVQGLLWGHHQLQEQQAT